LIITKTFTSIHKKTISHC